MFVKRMDPAHFEAAYGILVQEVYPWPEAAATPFGAVWAIVEPKGRTKHHNHQEGETFFVTAGHGRYRVGDEVIEVGPGDAVFQPPFHSHVIENPSESENLVFLSVYWEDLHLWNAAQAAALFAGERPKRMLVTAGSAASPAAGRDGDQLAVACLAGDIISRYLRLRGVDVSWVVTGDGAPGSTAERTLRAPGAEPDLSLGGPAIRALAEELFLGLHGGGELLESSSPGAGARPVRRLVFPLSRHADALAERALHDGMGVRQRAFLEAAAAAGLPDLEISVPGAEGIPVPVAGFAGQVLSPWIEAAARAVAAARARGAAPTVDCFGGADLFLHAVAVPALLHAFDPALRPAASYVLSEPCRMGLSSGELERLPADLLRFHLAGTWPETEATEIRSADVERTAAGELAGIWQPWLASLGARLAEERGGEIPATGDWTEDHRRFYARLQELVAEAAAAYEPRSFSPQQAVRAMAELVRAARRFGQAEAHWRSVAARSEERRTGLALELLAAKSLALAAAPVMPGFAARIWRELGFTAPLGEARWEDRPSWLAAGQRLQGLGGPYFALAAEPAPAAEAPLKPWQINS